MTVLQRVAEARAAGREVAFSLSDPFVIERHGQDFRALAALDPDRAVGAAGDGEDRHARSQRG